LKIFLKKFKGKVFSPVFFYDLDFHRQSIFCSRFLAMATPATGRRKNSDVRTHFFDVSRGLPMGLPRKNGECDPDAVMGLCDKFDFLFESFPRFGMFGSPIPSRENIGHENLGQELFIRWNARLLTDPIMTA